MFFCAHVLTERSAETGIMFVKIVLQGVPSSTYSHHNMIPQDLHTHTHLKLRFKSKDHLQFIADLFINQFYYRTISTTQIVFDKASEIDQHIPQDTLRKVALK